jgi:hypothetical protein
VIAPVSDGVKRYVRDLSIVIAPLFVTWAIDELKEWLKKRTGKVQP